ALRFRFAPPTADTGDGGVNALTIPADHSVGAGHEAEQRAARVAKGIDGPLWKAQEVTSDPLGEPIEIDEHDAFGVEQLILGTLNWYLVTLEGTEDARIEEAKAALKSALKDLTDTLSDVHWPAHNDQHDEDHSFTDEEWADILKRSSEGEKSASEKVSAAWAANRALKVAQETVIQEMRKQIAKLDQTIARMA
ncbi:MAG: hypothetical protein B7Y88_11290, partial [Sphingomonadales bacterium 32-64-17]